MGRTGSSLTEERLVPFEAARHVRYPYNRPRAPHSVPLLRPILTETALDTVTQVYADRPRQAKLNSWRSRTTWCRPGMTERLLPVRVHACPTRIFPERQSSKVVL